MRRYQTHLASLFFLYLPLLGGCQGSGNKPEEVVSYDRNAARKYEAAIMDEYLQGTSLELFTDRNELVERCASLSSTNEYKELSLSYVRTDCERHHRECDQIINSMNLIIEWIMEDAEALTASQAIHEQLYVQNKRKLIELQVNSHLKQYHHASVLQQMVNRRDVSSFILQLDDEQIVLSDIFKTATLKEIKEFTFAIKDWVLVNESKVLRDILRDAMLRR